MRRARFSSLSNSSYLIVLMLLNALKVVLATNCEMFILLSQGPIVMSLKAMEERLARVEGIERTALLKDM